MAAVIRRGKGILVVAACTLLISAGCTVGSTTNNTTNTNNGGCDAAGGTNSVNCSSAQVGDASAPTPASAPHTSTEADGKQLGSYLVTLSDGYHVPIGPSRPVASQITATGTGDLIYSTFAGETSISPIPPYSSIAPISGVPTYQGCLDDTNKQDSVGAGAGTAFCLYEQGLIVGGVVTYINSHEINPDSAAVQITVWSNAS
jgi:hypothetical protein